MTTSISVIPTGGTVPISLEDLAAAVLVATNSAISPDGHLMLGTLAGAIDLGLMPGWAAPPPASVSVISVTRSNNDGLEITGVKNTGNDNETLEAFIDGATVPTYTTPSFIPDGTYGITAIVEAEVGAHSVIVTSSITGLSSATMPFTVIPYIALISVTRVDSETISVVGYKATGQDENLSVFMDNFQISMYSATLPPDGPFNFIVQFPLTPGPHPVEVAADMTSNIIIFNDGTSD
jgi:hypothetical protein